MLISSSVLLLGGMQRQPSTQKVLHYLNLQYNSLLSSALSFASALQLKELKQNLTADRQDTSILLNECVIWLVGEHANATVFEHLVS